MCRWINEYLEMSRCHKDMLGFAMSIYVGKLDVQSNNDSLEKENC